MFDKTTTPLPPTGFIRLKQVLQFIPVSKSTIWAKVAEGTFPAPVKLGPRTTAWRVEDILDYIEKTVSQQKCE